jgi:hypothetical protein
MALLNDREDGIPHGAKLSRVGGVAPRVTRARGRGARFYCTVNTTRIGVASVTVPEPVGVTVTV